MAILKRQLDPDEDVLVETIPHWIFVAKPAVVTALTLAVAVAVSVLFSLNGWLGWVPVVAVAVPALWLAVCVVRWRCTKLVVTSNPLIVRRGAFSRQTMQIRLNRVNEVGYNQPFFQRLLGTGELLVETGGEDGVEVFPYARKPAVLQRVINQQLDVVQGNFRPGAGIVGQRDERPLVGPEAPTDPGHRKAPGQAPPAIPVSGWQVPPVPGGALPPPAASSTPPSTPPATPAPAVPYIPEQIVQLDQLRQRGLLSEDEFQAKKKELLDRM